MAKVVKSSNRGSKPGERRGGRQKGIPNKVTATMREAITAVYEKLQETAGEDHGHFLDWAVKNPTQFYLISSKLLPLQVTGEGGGDLKVEIVRLSS